MKECPECHHKALKCIDSMTVAEPGMGSITVFRSYICGQCGKYFESTEKINYHNEHHNCRRKR